MNRTQAVVISGLVLALGAFAYHCVSNTPDDAVRKGGEAVLIRVLPAGYTDFSMGWELHVFIPVRTCSASVRPDPANDWRADDEWRTGFHDGDPRSDEGVKLSAYKDATGWHIRSTDIDTEKYTLDDFEELVKGCVSSMENVDADRRAGRRQQREDGVKSTATWTSAHPTSGASSAKAK